MHVTLSGGTIFKVCGLVSGGFNSGYIASGYFVYDVEICIKPNKPLKICECVVYDAEG